MNLSFTSGAAAGRRIAGATGFFLLCVLSFAIDPGTARAQVILNPNFTANTVFVDGGLTGSISNWSTNSSILTEVVNTENPSGSEYALAAGLSGIAPGMSGDQCLDFNTALLGGSASAWQTTSTALTLNRYYTLSVSVGAPLNAAFQGYQISILSGATVLATSGALYSVTAGTFATESLTFFTNSSFSAYAGTDLTVELTAPGAAGLLGLSSAGVDFDNVQFTVAAVPEPSEFWLMGLAILALVTCRPAFRRRGFSSR